MSDNDERIKEHQRRLTLRVPLPNDIDGNSPQMLCILCFNRNVVGPGCTAMRGLEVGSENCMRYCPHFKNR